jgi:uncharacterized membrane protein
MSVESDGHLKRFLRGLPLDLVVVLAVLGVILTLSLQVSAQPTALRVVLGSLLLFVLPGYVLVAVIFPGNGGHRGSRTAIDRASPTRGITWRERLALSFGASVALVPVLGLLVALAGPFQQSLLFASIALFVIVGVVLALLRRLQLPPRDRFTVPVGRWADDLSTFLFSGGLRNSALNLVLAASVLLALGAVTVAVAVPQPGTQYTSFALMTEQRGDLVSSGYPTEFTLGQSEQLVYTVTNNRAERTQYTVVVEFQQLRTGDGQVTVLSERELARMQTTLEPGQTWRRPHWITPPVAGDNNRVVYTLYRGDAPADGSIRTADEYLQLWVNVSAR